MDHKESNQKFPSQEQKTQPGQESQMHPRPKAHDEKYGSPKQVVLLKNGC